MNPRTVKHMIALALVVPCVVIAGFLFPWMRQRHVLWFLLLIMGLQCGYIAGVLLVESYMRKKGWPWW